MNSDSTCQQLFQHQSLEITELVKALCKAQAEITGAVKNKKNPHFKSSYSDLESVIDACKVPLVENGLAFVQILDEIDEKPYLITKLYHVSGQWLASRVPIINTKGDAQGLGSAISYARRYGLSALCGIYQVDDDGNTAVQPQKITQTQVKELAGMLPSDSASVEKFYVWLHKLIGSTRLQDIPADAYEKIRSAVAKRTEEKQQPVESENVSTGV